MRDYYPYNESRSNRKRNRQKQKYSGVNFNQQHLNPPINSRSSVSDMVFSDRFKYVLKKISKNGNKIAQELLTLPENKDRKFNMSYLDLTNTDDMLSYLLNPYQVPEGDRFKSNKRQRSKVYKIIKTIFSNKYTSAEVKKFVSFFKEIYHAGPDAPLKKGAKKEPEEIVKQVIDGTKNKSLSWVCTNFPNYLRFEAHHKLTDKKRILFQLCYMPDRIESSWFSINLERLEHGAASLSNRSWIATYNYPTISELIKILI